MDLSLEGSSPLERLQFALPDAPYCLDHCLGNGESLGLLRAPQW